MLTLPIKKKWFDMIKSREKKEEYREIKPYYASRFYKNYIVSGTGLEWILNNNPTIFKSVIFRNGYSSNSPKIQCYVKIQKGYGKEEWGAEPNKEYYVLKILSVEEVQEAQEICKLYEEKYLKSQSKMTKTILDSKNDLKS